MALTFSLPPSQYWFSFLSYITYNVSSKILVLKQTISLSYFVLFILIACLIDNVIILQGDMACVLMTPEIERVELVTPL